MVYENIYAIGRKDAATLVDVTTTMKYRKVKQTDVEHYQKVVRNKDLVVLLPIKYSVEHFKDNEVQVASLCEYSTFEILGQDTKDSTLSDIAVGYRCLNRCFIKNLVVKNNRVYVDIETIDNQPFEPEHDAIRK